MKKLLYLLFVLPLLSFGQEKVVAGYFPYYRDVNTTDWSGYTDVYFAFGFPTLDGGLEVNKSQFEAFVAKSDELDFKKYISLGTTGFPAMAVTDENRKSFADTLRKFCEAYELDGADMDWEAINNSTDSLNFRLLMQDIRAEFDDTDLALIATIGDGDYNLKWYSNLALQQADWLQIMIYDKTGTWSTSPFGNHASMQHFKDAETYWNNRGFTDEQLVMGVPFYGYRFESTAGGSAEAIPYEDIVKRFPDINPEDNYLIDETGHYWFNGQDLMKEKRDYVFDNEFKGIFTWEMSQDIEDNDRSLLKPFLGEEYPEGKDAEMGIELIKENEDWFTVENGQFTLTDKTITKVEFYDASGKLLSFSTNEKLPKEQVLLVKGYSKTTIKSSKLAITK
jgi:chitinase